MEPEKIHDIQDIDVVHLPKRHSEGYWYNNDDSYIRNYITGKDNPAFSGIGFRGLNNAKNEYMSLGNTFRRKSLSAPQMAKYENKYHIDQSLFDVARDEIESEYNADAEKYQSGKISDKRWNRKSQRYEQQMRNLDENQYILDQQQNPLKYSYPHKTGDIAPLVFSLGLPATIIGVSRFLPFLSSLAKTGIQNKIVKDFLVGGTAGMTADGVVRQVTPYHGVADGLVKQVAQLYYDLKYPDFKKNARINSNKDYQNFLNSNAYLPLTFAAEFVNPVNWLNPASAASKIGLSRTFDNLGNEIVNGTFIDPVNQFKRNQQIWKSGHIEVENETPQAVFDLFKNNKHLQSIKDVYHGAKYTRHYGDNGILVGSIDDRSGRYINNPNDIIIAPKIEMNPEGYVKLQKMADDLPKHNQIMLIGNIFNARHGYNSPQPITSAWNLPSASKIVVSDNSKNQILQNIDNQLNQIAQGEFNGKHLSLPLLWQTRNKLASEPLFLNQRDVVISNTGIIDDIHSKSPKLRALLSNDDFLEYENGRLRFARLDDTRTQIPITFVADSPTKERVPEDVFNPNRSWTYFDGMVIRREPKQNSSGKSDLVTRDYSTGLFNLDDLFILGSINENNITRTLANTVNNPNSLDLVDINGNVNISAYNNMKKKLAKVLGKSEEEINTLFSVNQSTTEGFDSLDNHLLKVARSAQVLPLPQGYTRQEAVTAALLHDLGKIINSSKLHGHSSVDLIDQLGIQINNPKVHNAIKYHMDSPEMNLFGMEGNTNFKGDEIDTNFSAFLHLADVARGASLEDTKFYFPHLFSYNYPKGAVLKGDPAEQMDKLNSLLINMGYDGIDTSLPIEQQWGQLQANMKRMNTFIRGSRAYFDPNDEATHIRNYQNAQYLAKQRGLNPDNQKDVWTVMQEQIPMEPTGSGRLNLFDSGNKTNPYHKIAKNTWSDAAAISPEKMDGLYFSVSPETGNTYMTASNTNSYSAQSTILRGELSDYDIMPDESPFEYFERLYPFIHRYQTASNYEKPTIPLSEFNQNVANTLLGRTISNTAKSDAVAILRKHFPHSDFMKIMNAGTGTPKILDIQNVAHTLTSIPQGTIDLYEKYGFSKLDAVLNNLTKVPQFIKSSVVDLPNYRNNIILNTNGTLYEPGSGWMGKDFQGIVVAPKGKKVFTVLDEINVDGFSKSSSESFRDAGGDNIREGLKINIPFYKTGNKLCKKQ